MPTGFAGYAIALRSTPPTGFVRFATHSTDLGEGARCGSNRGRARGPPRPLDATVNHITHQQQQRRASRCAVAEYDLAVGRPEEPLQRSPDGSSLNIDKKQKDHTATA